MIRYAAERLGLGVLVVVGVVVLTFLIARVIPGDPAVTYAGPRASKAQLEQVRKQLGLNQPVIVQLGDYLKGIATGDWGTSYRTKREWWRWTNGSPPRCSSTGIGCARSWRRRSRRGNREVGAEWG